MSGHLAPKHILMCSICGRMRPTTPEQQLKYVSKGWPKCCEEVMVLYLEAEKPNDNGKSRQPPE